MVDVEVVSKLKTPAKVGWGLVAATVVGYDVWALRGGFETLSACWWRASQTRRGRVALTAGWLGLTWHLLMGSRQVLPARHHQLYLRIHPIWAIHDRLLREAARQERLL